MIYTISEAAKADLENIWLYTFEIWSEIQADRYYNLILDEIEFIAENPSSGKNYNYIRTGYYRSKVKSHFIFYKVNPKGNQVEIIRILLEKMDIENRLND